MDQRKIRMSNLPYDMVDQLWEDYRYWKKRPPVWGDESSVASSQIEAVRWKIMSRMSSELREWYVLWKEYE